MESVRAAEIVSLLADLPEEVRTLSLDCFDTLIWRNVHAPVDVFHDLDLPGGAMHMRIAAEQRARRALMLERRGSEVRLEEIYGQLFRDDDASAAGHVEAELKAEKRHCFAFAPVAELIAAAKTRGLRVIVVSDTYLSEPQLRGLITTAAGEETTAHIDRIFCSSEHGVGKAGGLFEHVLEELGEPPQTIFHFGDNRVADHEAPQTLGIHARHFEQFDAEAHERLRLEAVAATLLEQDVRRAAPALQPHRAAVSLRADEDPVDRFGHDVLGPIMQGFVHWVAEQADALAEASGKTPKLLFLLRDGFLPAQAFAAAYPERADNVAMIELSRLTANAASFTDRKAVERYLVAEAASNKQDAYSQARQAAYCRQLLFTSKETGKLSRISSPRAFMREVLKPDNLAKITARAEAFGQRLFAHLRAAGVEQGDAVMLVDLGYNGSVQNAVEPVLRAGMKLDVHGRYLLLREVQLGAADKKGMIDIRHYDYGALNALCESIAVVEQLCTVAQGSVVDYGEDGTPIRAREDIKASQSEARDAAQAACLGYLKDAGRAWSIAPASWDGDCARRMAAASLARLLFLPVASEVEMFASFVHDVNMGTGDLIKLIDPEAAAEGLRRRGLFYTKNISRMYLPGELKQQGITALLPMFVGRRFDLDLRQTDFQGETMTMPVVLMDADDHVQIDVEAYPTAEGFYQALIPVGAGRFTAGLMLGQDCEWVQVEEASFHYVDGYMDKKIDDDGIAGQPMFENMTKQASGLYRCDGADAFVVVPPPAVTGEAPMMLSFVFRPVVRRNRLLSAVRQAA